MPTQGVGDGVDELGGVIGDAAGDDDDALSASRSTVGSSQSGWKYRAMARTKRGVASLSRPVIRLPSTTTGASTKVPRRDRNGRTTRKPGLPADRR